MIGLIGSGVFVYKWASLGQVSRQVSQSTLHTRDCTCVRHSIIILHDGVLYSKPAGPPAVRIGTDRHIETGRLFLYSRQMRSMSV